MIEGSTYQIRVIAVNEVGESEPSEPSDEFTPMAPTSEVSMLRVGKQTDDSIELKWLEPEDIGAGGIDKYILEMKKVPIGGKVEDAEYKDAPCGTIDPSLNNINFDRLETGASYYFRICTENSAGRSEWREIGPIICAEEVQAAKINIPREYANNKRINVPVGNPIKLIIPFCGKPKPIINWNKDGEELPKDDNGRPKFQVRTVGDQTTLYCRSCERWDSGVYKLQVQVGTDVVFADFNVQVIDIPSQPRAFKCQEVLGTSVALKWTPPKDDGNCDIWGYQIERRDARDEDWWISIEKIRNCSVQINDLILGNSYYFRIRAFNEVGLGDTAETKEAAVIVKDKVIYKKPVLPPLDFSTKPEFTKPLNDRKIMMGYNGILTTSLKGFPKPKLRWYKGKTEIIDNPKYKTTFENGIVQLEIRRARPGDAGVYKLIATNSVDTAECEATVIVKELKDA